MQITGSLLSNLLDVVQEVQLARVEIRNLVQAKFNSHSGRQISSKYYTMWQCFKNQMVAVIELVKGCYLLVHLQPLLNCWELSYNNNNQIIIYFGRTINKLIYIQLYKINHIICLARQKLINTKRLNNILEPNAYASLIHESLSLKIRPLFGKIIIGLIMLSF
jgi:hypothetical protein